MARRRKQGLPSWTGWTFSKRRARLLSYLAVSYAILSVFFLLNLMAVPLPYLGLVKIPFFLMAVYYWSIQRPGVVPPWFCFLTGILLDILSGMIPGLQALMLVAVQGIVQDQRRFLLAQPYATIWMIFAFVMAAVSVAQWSIYGIVNGMKWADPVPAAISAVAAFFLFPLATLALGWANRRLPVASRP